MSKAKLPSGNQSATPSCLVPSNEIRAAQLYTFFKSLQELASNNPNKVFDRVESAVQGKSIADALYVQTLISKLYICLMPEQGLLCDLTDHYEQLAEKEVTPC